MYISSTYVARTDQYTSYPSLCHLSPDTVAQWLERLTEYSRLGFSFFFFFSEFAKLQVISYIYEGGYFKG